MSGIVLTRSRVLAAAKALRRAAPSCASYEPNREVIEAIGSLMTGAASALEAIASVDPPPQTTTLQCREMVLQALAADPEKWKTQAQIADAVGVSVPTVRRILIRELDSNEDRIQFAYSDGPGRPRLWRTKL